MSLANYSAFKVSALAWCDVTTTDISTSQTDDCVNIAENRIFRELRTRDMESSTTATISSGVIPVPADYREMKNAYVNRDPIVSLERQSAEWVLTNYPQRAADDGDPMFIARDGANFIFGPNSSGDQVVIKYWRNPTAMSGGTDTVNGIFSANEDLYLWATLVEIEMFLQRPKRAATWEARYQSVLRKVNGEAKDEYFSGSRLAVRPG